MQMKQSDIEYILDQEEREKKNCAGDVMRTYTFFLHNIEFYQTELNCVKQNHIA